MAQTVLNETQIPDVVTDNTIYGTGKTGDPLGVSGTSLPFNFVTGSIAFADSAGFLIEDNKHLRYNSTLRSVRMGKDAPFNNFADLFPFFATAEFAGESIVNGVYAYGTGTSGLPLPGFGSYRSRGTPEAPTVVKKDDVLGSFYGTGYDGADFYNGGRVRFYADVDWTTGANRASRTAFLVTPSGTTSQIEKMVLYGDSLNLINTGTYNVNGSPHTHTAAQVGVVQETNTDELFRVAASPGGTSRWEGTFTAAGSSGATIKYATTAGLAAIMTPFATSNLGKMRLYNTTRGNSVLISNHVAGTITSTANYPADWTNGDVLTTNSQTVTFAAAGAYYVDIEITSGPTGKSAMFVIMNLISATAGDAMIIHPFSAYAASQVKIVKELVAGQGTNNLHLIKITSNVFSLNWQGTPTTVYVREQGYIT